MERVADIAYDKIKDISDQVDAFNEVKTPESSLKANDKYIKQIMESYVKAIRIMRNQLSEGWIPLLEGKVSEIFIDDPTKFTEKEWEDKTKEIDRIIDSISLFIRR